MSIVRTDTCSAAKDVTEELLAVVQTDGVGAEKPTHTIHSVRTGLHQPLRIRQYASTCQFFVWQTSASSSRLSACRSPRS